MKQVLLRHFNEHQRTSDRRSLPIDARVSQIYEEVDRIKHQAEADQDNVEGALDEAISQTLIYFLECSLATEVSQDTKESIVAIQELVAAVAAKRIGVVTAVLHDRLVSLTVVLLERVRSAACRCIGWTVQYLFQNEELTKEELETLLDKASQALIPRFTDKAQSVRQAAVEASRFFFHRAIGQVGEEIDDPDIRQSLQWSLQHDPSVTNRVAAMESLPVTLQTMDVILTRVRDTKAKVRVAAVKALRQNIPHLEKWESEQCSELIESGWTDRCAVTKAEIEQTVFGWLKSMNFDINQCLRHLDVVEFEDTCQKVMAILLEASDETLSENYSEDEIIRYKRAVKECTKKIVAANQALEAEQVFLLRARCAQAEKLEPRQRELVLCEILPDIPEVCEMFELHASALMKAIAEEKEFSVTNRLVCVSLQLLSLVKSAEIEEGSRLHLKSTLKSMIESVVVPDDLIEGCIETLQRIHRTESDFWDTVHTAVESLCVDVSEDGLSDNRILRLLSILCIVFERSSSHLASHPAVENFSSHVVPAASHENALIREAAISCLGKLGLFSDKDRVLREFKPLLLQVASDESEKLAIRAQALLGLSDWSMMFADTLSSIVSEVTSVSFVEVLADMIRHHEVSLACVAAEVVCKLLTNGRICDTEGTWLGQLLVFFFDPRLVAAAEEAEEDDGNTEVGSPIRLQQLLTLFFPLYCMRNERGPGAFPNCVAGALEIVSTRDSGKKKRGSKSFPILKMVDFVLSITLESEKMMAESAKKNGKDDPTKGSSPQVLIAMQIAKFLAHHSDELGVTNLRALAKILGTTELNRERECKADMKKLVELMEDLGNQIVDEASLDHLSCLNELLDDVDLSSQSNPTEGGGDESSDTDESTEQNYTSPSRIVPEKENTGNRTPNTAAKRGSGGTAALRSSRLSMSSIN